MKPSMIPRLNKVLKQRIESLPDDIRSEGEVFLDELLKLSCVAENNDLNMGDIFEQQTVRSLTLSESPNDSHHKKAQAIRFMSGILPMERKAGVTIKLTQFFKAALETGREESLVGPEYDEYLDKIMSIYSHPGNRPEMAMISLQLESDIKNEMDTDPNSISRRQKLTQLVNDCWMSLNPGWSPSRRMEKGQEIATGI